MNMTFDAPKKVSRGSSVSFKALLCLLAVCTVMTVGTASENVEFPICAASNDQERPAISNGFVVWDDGRNLAQTGWDIYGYDLYVQQGFSLYVAPGDQRSPAISGDIVAWEDSRNFGITGWDIYRYDLATQQEFPICTAPGDQRSPAISGSIVVWEDSRNFGVTGWDIYGYDLITQQQFPICTAPGDQRSPAISGSIVVWEDSRNFTVSGWDIYANNLATGMESAVCTAWADQYDPDISDPGWGGQTSVVWTDLRNDPGDLSNSDIYARWLGDSWWWEFAICTQIGNQNQPKINSSVVVWADERNYPGDAENTDIYGCGLPWSDELVFSGAPGQQSSPAISGSLGEPFFVVWGDYRNRATSGGDIYGFEIHHIVLAPFADPSVIGSGKTTQIRTETWAVPGPTHGFASWSWSDNGAGGVFSPNAHVQSPTWTAPSNSSDVPVTYCLTVTGTCADSPSVSASEDLYVVVEPSCYLTVASDPPQGGTISGGGAYSYGSIATVTATANTGWQFVSWTGLVASPTLPSTTVLMGVWNQTGDKSVVAHFSLSPAAPNNLRVTGIGAVTINLAWNDNSSNETGFKIERKTGASGTYAQIATVGANVVSYSNTGLSVNTTYYYRVRAYNDSGNSAYSGEVNATTYALPGPSSLTATAVSNSQINLTWKDNAGNESGFKIERKTGVGGTYAQIATVGANVVSYQNTGLAASTTYYYRVRAYNASGNSAYSGEVGATTPAFPAPSNLTAAAASATQINLTWKDNSTNETGFKIERKTGAAGTWSQIATAAANTVSYQNTGLTSSTTYYYRVRAYNSVSNFAYSNEASATTRALPAAPSNLTATSASASQINLSWTDNASDETGFKIERKTGATGTWSQVATAAANVVTYNNTGLAAATTYYYRVRSYNANGNSVYSNEASAATAPLPAPSSLTAAAASATQINVTWKDNSTNESGFKIERKTGATGTWSQIATAAANIVSYQNTGLTASTTYYYRVRAYNSVSNSAYSNEATATTRALPVAPSGLTASSISPSQINLSWTDNASDETGFKIERKTGSGGTWTQIATATANVVTYNNTGLAAATTYYYRVRSYNANGNSAYSNEANAATAPLPAPSSLTAAAASATQINLAWRDNSTNESGFKIERKTGATGTWSQIATTAANIVSYQNTGLTASTTYYYRVRAYNSVSNSAYSNEASAATRALPVAPSNLTATSASASQISLAWKDNSSDESGFRVERRAVTTGVWTQIASVGANVTTYQNTGLSGYTTYYYRVRSYNANGNSAYSNEASATPALPAPTSLTAAAVSTTQINLAWQDKSSNETGFKIERKTGATGSWSQIAAVGANATSYQNTGLIAATAYYYRVRAYNASGNSVYSNEAHTTTLAAAPSSPTAFASQINLAWRENSANETGFNLERKTGAGGILSERLVLPSTSTTTSQRSSG